MIKAYGYLRVSGTGQVEGGGFDRQREAVIGFADQAGIVIPRFYEEQGVSGTKGEEDRPAFQEMLTTILSNGVQAENGKCEGAKSWEETEPERKEEILKVIKKMRRKPRNQGKPSSYQAIADCLNAEGLRPLRGGEWSAQLVRSFHSRTA